MAFSAPAIKATELLETPIPVTDRRTIQSTIPWMLWWIVGVHYSWGLGFILRPKILHDLVTLIGLDWILNIGVSTQTLGIILISVSTMASFGLVMERHLSSRKTKNGIWYLIILLCPQYFLVLAAFVSDLNTMVNGSVHGRDVERWLLICVLTPVVWGAFLHTAAILERYALIWKRH